MNRAKACLLFAIATLLLTPLSVSAQPSGPTIQWPRKWTVFGPLDRLHPVVSSKLLASVPASIEMPKTDLFPALTLKPLRIPVTAGKPADLSAVLRNGKAGETAYVFVEIEASDAGEVTLGFGADWWMQAWINGKPLFDTLKAGNVHSPISVANHKVSAALRRGKNVLAVRFVRGLGSAQLALGDAAHIAVEQALLERRSLNTMPKTFAERACFPVDEQAVVMAARDIEFPEPDADLSRGGLAGKRAMPARQIYLSAGPGRKPEILDTESRRFPQPVALVLSKFAYPREDRHLDAIVWTTSPEDKPLRGSLDVILKSADGGVLAHHKVADLSPTGVFFSVGFPDAFKGGKGALEVVWRRDNVVIGRAEEAFLVMDDSNAPRSGKVPLLILNEPKARIAGAPMTVGVPFPRGALYDQANARLVDEKGVETPLQTRVTAKWSRYGPVKWMLCDFTADLDGSPRTLYLEYGPTVRRKAASAVAVTERDSGFPDMDAGRVNVTREGVGFEPRGGTRRLVLGPTAMLGAFVEHENKKTFAVPADTKHFVEEIGSEKVVVRRTGWYVAPDDGARFCQFVTRMVFHRDSPVVRIFHTWIFTGDGNRDRIRDMGWRFAAPSRVERNGILTSFVGGEWAKAGHLVQSDFQKFSVDGQKDRDGRTPGVLSAGIGKARVVFGAKDFWQRFPNELEFEDSAFTFHNWPRHNPAASFERPVSPAKAFLHRYAHEGVLLDFRLPREYAEDAIWAPACEREKHWDKGRPETANAQGIARTEEMFLYFADSAVEPDQAARVMQGLIEESMRAVVDPKWVSASGVFGDIHPRDAGKYEEDEHLYEQVVCAPSRWNERLGFYGKWLHGDVPAWSIDLQTKTVSLYRTLRKMHHGWPVGWLPFARSGDPRMLKLAEAATRQQTDVSFCHFATEDVNASVGPDHYRGQGWWLRGLLPWGGTLGPRNRSYTVDSDFLWDAYYLTGYTRARDVALLWGELTKRDWGSTGASRTSCSMRRSYLDMYEATFDPWFLSATLDFAKLHLAEHGREEVVDKMTHEYISHFWRACEPDFYQYHGGEEYRRLALNHCVSWSSPRSYTGGGLWNRLSLPLIVQSAFAYKLTGDDFHLARVAAYLDWVRFGVFDGEPEYARGTNLQGGTACGIFTGYYIRHFPFALAAFERAGFRPEPIPNPFFVTGTEVGKDRTRFFEFEQPEVVFRKTGPSGLSLMLDSQNTAPEVAYAYEIEPPAGGVKTPGTWRLNAPRMVDVPANAPTGNYRLRITGKLPLTGNSDADGRVRRKHGVTLVPVAPPDTPEVMVFARSDKGTRVARGFYEVQYWFIVPQGVAEFWIEFPIGGGGLNRLSVWNPDGRRAWDHNYVGEGNTPPLRVTVPVPPQHQGKLWRATGSSFLIDPRIPPYFSTSRAKWFNPEEE